MDHKATFFYGSPTNTLQSRTRTSLRPVCACVSSNFVSELRTDWVVCDGQLLLLK